MQTSMRRVSLGDVDLEFSAHGEGEPLLLVHGGLVADGFLPVSEVPAFDGFCVIRVRRAGYDPTAMTQHLSVQAHARSLGSFADALGIAALHWVGHGSSCQIGLQLALDRPSLVHSLILFEPAPGGGFTVPSSEELGRQCIGPSLGAFAAGHLATAFNAYLGGVAGANARAVIEARLGREGYERAVLESGFFFRSELRAVLEWRFEAAEASRITQPVLVVEGVESAALGPLSREITERVRTLLPHADVAFVEEMNHLMPLQDPETIAHVIASFARHHSIGPMAPQ